ncbi:glycerophosphodiester phosphodiesterase family protein [Microbacterium sp. TNHR37B]|uniref:glycerophosphodiester phosphodiesterase family protein n=1 Tax=Microbacterium sp. TNHR37B TaxID=1775956 RepID=UPI0007B23D2E|nr:glycerophosphodiester phosphodiesterase family protein [Microbacterium sp. TNHR37B]KZE90805.1 hypothetical protein AVP41_00325 [Microbacterium sp. TNHR37B]
MTHPWFLPDRPRILAHRGFVPDDAEGVVENSLAALAGAHAVGAEYVESDCHLTADDVVVLLHDADLQRVAGDPRSVRDVTVRELEELMSTRGGLVTLAQALDGFPTLRFNLDVKAADAAEQVGRDVARHSDRVLLTSFSDRRRRLALDAARALGGRPATSAGSSVIARTLAAVATRSSRAVRRVLDGVDAVQVPLRQGPVPIVRRRFIDAVHAAGVEVHVWTINDEDLMAELLELGVDGVVTDRADRALAVLRSRS